MSDDLNRWCEAFLADNGMAPADLAPMEGTVDPDRPLRAPDVPVRYATALPGQPRVLEWLAEVLRQAAKDRRAVASVSTGPSLLLLGATGTGKTHECYGLLRVLRGCGLYGRMRLVPAADLYARMRPRHGIDTEEEFTHFADASLLIVDDLGAAKGSEWTEEVSYRLVNHRYERTLPTVFTSNITPGELAGVLGERVASRLNEMATRVALKGTDRRYRS